MRAMAILIVMMVAVVSAAGGLTTNNAAPIQAQGARKAEKAPELPVENTGKWLTEADHPFPLAAPLTLVEYTRRVRLYDDYVVTNDYQDFTELEQVQVGVYIKHTVREIFQRQMESGWIQLFGAPMESPALDDVRIGLCRTHAASLLALLRLGVPISEERMIRAYRCLLKHVKAILEPWKQSGLLKDIEYGGLTELLSLTLQTMHDWNRQAVVFNPKTKSKTNPLGLTKEDRQWVADIVKAIEARKIGGGPYMFGWRSGARNQEIDNPSFPATAFVLQGLLAAQRMGHDFKSQDLAFLHHNFSRLLWMQGQDAEYEGTVTFTRGPKFDAGGKSEDQSAVTANPRGWSVSLFYHPNAKMRKRNVNSRAKHGTDSSRHGTSGALGTLVIGRKLLEGSGSDPFKEVLREKFDEAVWDGIAYLSKLPLDGNNWRNSYSTNRTWGSALLFQYETLTSLGVIGIGDPHWYRLAMKYMLGTINGLKQSLPCVEIISAQEADGFPEDHPSTQAKLIEYWKSLDTLVPPGLRIDNVDFPMILMLHGFIKPVPLTPATTGGKRGEPEAEPGKSGTRRDPEAPNEKKEPEKGKDGEKKSDDNPSSPKEPNKAGADAG